MSSQQELKNLLEEVVKSDATDLHLGVGKQPALRINGNLVSAKQSAVLTPEHIADLVLALLREDQKIKLQTQREIDFSYSLEDKARFRVNVYYQKGYLSAALRLIPTKIRTIEELHLPESIKEFTKPSQGFVLIVGPAGHGKTSVMAALVDIINHTRQEHIVTIEDPIEYIFTQDKCIISQREVGIDTKSFHSGLRSMFREDPDVVMIGEMRDPESIATAVTGAETGHLVFASLHTNTAAQTIDRIIDSFPSHQQNQIRVQLAATLLGIISRRLLPTIKGKMTSAVEILIANPALRNIIREGKTHQIDLVIETSADQGMISLNKSLANLVKKQEITLETAEIYSPNPLELKALL
ncbi:MAG: PilT/PilU family type 4a pilus ATPase [bacterium]